MTPESKDPFHLTRIAQSAHVAQRGNCLSVHFSRATHTLYILLLLLALGSTAMAQNNTEPALPGSVEYTLTLDNETWIQTSDPINIGTYVYDLLTDNRLGQPDGRGAIGIVTGTSFDPDYNEMAAAVDFGRDYTAGIVFSELSAVEIVAAPEPSPRLMLLLGLPLLLVLGRGAKPAS